MAERLRVLGYAYARARDAQVGERFTEDPAADRFVRAEPNAFLIGVLFTQGIPAERAWSAPWRLKERLGHFDLLRLRDDVDAVHAAIATPPALHRFVRTVPCWVSSAAGRLLADYDGHAQRIWPDGSRVTDVVARLSAFDGIGPKKAVMASEILARHFGVRLEGRQDGTVAFDVHVRRVFLRTGLADRDARSAVEEAARAACPEAPSTLDLPAWLIGRQYCRPQRPRCDECPLGDVCPRYVTLDVVGVGARARLVVE